MVKALRSVLYIFIAIVFTAMSYRELVLYQPLLEQDPLHKQEVLYLPNQEALSLVSFGYKNVLARILWFNTINYFGKHYRSDKNYYWLENMCTLVVALDSKAQHVYEFCALMLAWEADSLEPSMNILKLMDKALPNSWRPRYLMGINAAFFADDNLAAQTHFVEAAKKPLAPVFLTRLAVKKLANLNSPQTAVAFLKAMIANAKDPNQKQAFEEHLKKTLHTIRLQELQKQVDAYLEQNKKLPDELNKLKQSNSLQDPFGGTYYIDEKGQVTSTSGIDSTSLFKYRKSPGKTKQIN